MCRLESSGRAVAKLRWGQIPAWAKDVKTGARLVNAGRDGTREAGVPDGIPAQTMPHPAEGGLEWRKDETGRQPWFIAAAGGAPMAFAWLWERWEKGDESIETLTILTTAASPGLIAIHDRQPVIIEPDNFDEWLAPGTPETGRLALARCAYEGALRPLAGLPASEQPTQRRAGPGAAAGRVGTEPRMRSGPE